MTTRETIDDDVLLARSVLTETLHGPVPARTAARLAEAVVYLSEQLALLLGEVRTQNLLIESMRKERP